MRKIFLTGLLAALGAMCAKTPMTSADLWELRTAGDPQITKDGKSVVYTVGWADKMTDQQYSSLWIAGSDGNDPRPLTTGAFRDSSPRLSPDNTKLAYLSNRSGRTQIRVRWLDSGQEAQITDLTETPASIEWSPDGKWISYIARVPGKSEWQIKMPERPAGARWAEPPVIIERLRWRQDGYGLLPPGYFHIFAVPATGGTPRQITTGDFNHGGPQGNTSYAWSPDSKTIYVSASRIADADYNLKGGDIYAFAVADGAVKQLTTREGPDSNPVPSPGGSKIAYVGHDWRFQSYNVNHLFVMNADGTGITPLTPKWDRDVRAPKWSWDGKTIYFLSDDRGVTHLYSVAAEGGEAKQLTSGTYQLGGGRAGDFTLANNMMIATVRTAPQEPGEVVTFYAHRGNDQTRVTQLNDSLLADRELGEVEEITYDSFDGKPIQGWIVKPPKFDPAKKYPLILDIHGGPHAMFGVGFQGEFQIRAARGFVVLYTNPRGSTGYGEDFGNIIHTKYPGDDYKDLMAGVDKILTKNYIDPKRMGVTGGSGGGLLTAWVIGHTDRFAAAVSQYPVTNWITQAGTADGGYTHSALWMKSLPWENPKQFLDHSPVFFAQNFKTPTMVITGEADYRTPMAESEELYFALKARKVPAVLVKVPDEPHGIRARTSHYIAKVEHILAWMEKYTR